jgi:hypothetical protein
MTDSSSVTDSLSVIERKLMNIIDKYQDSQKIHLFVAYYQDKNTLRNQEIQLCIKLNANNKLFRKVFIMSETGSTLDFIQTQSDRIQIIPSPRLRFSDFFTFANTQTTPETINILINTDIVLGENFDQIHLEDDQMLCISRHDLTSEGDHTVVVGGGSHDCWVWKGYIKETCGQFYMGKILCDGVLAHQLTTVGYKLKNPIYDLKVYHVHLTNVRNYTWDDQIRGPRAGVKFSKNDNRFLQEDIYWDGCN